MEDTNQYLIVWMTKRKYFSKSKGVDKFEYTDNYHAAEGINEAQTFYNGLLEEEDNLYSASLCAVIESTDYTTHPKLKEV